ncbi:MAG TPA: RNA polymerase sigma factor [Thermoanaerobaculia bacterium]|nr:RNA polymerase sigma factor [Thermoanaerobaculia bacterium]
MSGSFGPLVHAGGVSYDGTAGATKQGATVVNRADLEQELEELHPASFAWALGLCRRDADEAQEVLQETYVKIFDGKARFDGRSSLKTWLFAVIRRTAAARRRLRWLRDLRFVAGDVSAVPDSNDSAERRVIHSERTSALIQALNRLARRQREIIELVFYHDMTIEEAAVVAGVSTGTARVHYHRAKQRLLAELEAQP